MDNKRWMCRRCGLKLTDIKELHEQCKCHPSKVQAVEVRKESPIKSVWTAK